MPCPNKGMSLMHNHEWSALGLTTLCHEDATMPLADPNRELGYE
jgi:hypothetical protein